VDWEIFGAQAFVEFLPIADDVMYLTNDKWAKPKKERSGDYDTYVNLVNWGARPHDRSTDIAPQIANKESCKLFFGESKEKLKIAKESKVMEAHRHRVENKVFVTLVYHKSCAFTFRIT
jgi:hypothetical protein